jgi:hypothetical protein
MLEINFFILHLASVIRKKRIELKHIFHFNAAYGDESFGFTEKEG